ncbi:MAG: hypothetical protein JWP34_4142 [Massilia sp.]|nr:hypothetical protein [Massilia sp.]
MNSQFNAIDYSQQLQAAGMPQALAEVQASTLANALATCAVSRAELAAFEEKLTTRMDMFETRVIARIEKFEASIKLELAGIRIELADMRGQINSLCKEMKYNRRTLNVVIALLVGLAIKSFFP